VRLFAFLDNHRDQHIMARGSIYSDATAPRHTGDADIVCRLSTSMHVSLVPARLLRRSGAIV
jgi:hypothetical protein